MRWKNRIRIGTALAGFSGIGVVNALMAKTVIGAYLLALSAGFVFGIAVLYLKEGWRRRYEQYVSYEVWLNTILDKPLPKRWR